MSCGYCLIPLTQPDCAGERPRLHSNYIYRLGGSWSDLCACSDV